MQTAIEILRKSLVEDQEKLRQQDNQITNYQRALDNSLAIRTVYQRSVDGLEAAIAKLEETNGD